MSRKVSTWPFATSVNVPGADLKVVIHPLKVKEALPVVGRPGPGVPDGAVVKRHRLEHVGPEGGGGKGQAGAGQEGKAQQLTKALPGALHGWELLSRTACVVMKPARWPATTNQTMLNGKGTPLRIGEKGVKIRGGPPSMPLPVKPRQGFCSEAPSAEAPRVA